MKHELIFIEVIKPEATDDYDEQENWNEEKEEPEVTHFITFFSIWLYLTDS